jgi:hypothetical protein
VKDWLREHSLSIVIIGIWLGMLVLSIWRFDGGMGDWFSERAGGHSDDAFGAMLLILLTKWLRERGSEESK